MTRLKRIDTEGVYVILHNGEEGLVWGALDCCIPLFYQKNILENFPIDAPDGWEFIYTDEDGLNKELSKLSKWKYIVNIHRRRALITRTPEHVQDIGWNQHLTPIPEDERLTYKGIKKGLDTIPEAIRKGKGKIIIEDSQEYQLDNQKSNAYQWIDEEGLDASRFQFLSGADRFNGDYFINAFEIQVIFDIYICKNSLENYKPYNATPSKRFICLNRKERPHRMLVYNEFIRRGLVKDSFYGYIGLNKFAFDTMRGDKLPNYLKVIGEKKLRTLPDISIDSFDQNLGWPRNGSTKDLINKFNNSAYYIVTETLDYEWGGMFLFPTEKIYKAFLHRIPFVVIGNPGLLKYLTSLGYDVNFDNIGMEYNELQDDQTEAFMNTMDLIETLPSKISQVDKNRCEHNFNILVENALPRAWENVLGLLND